MSYKEGFLTKQGGFIKSWKKRWFVLTKVDLVYYDKAGGAEKGKIPIVGSTASLAPECKAQPAFKVVTKTRTYYVVGADQMDVNLWVQAIRNVQSGEADAGGIAQNADIKKIEEEAASTAPKKKYTIDDFQGIATLGKGTYGKVSLVRYKGDGKVYALKEMSKKTLANAEQIKQILTERDVLMRNKHPFLVSAQFAFQSEDKIFLVLDYVPGGELFQRLSDEGTFSESRVRLYAAEILLGIGHLHNLGFIYRDLKPENILVDAGGHLKITDFGLAKRTDGTTATFCGTPEYIAPEMLTGRPYTKSVDWWSFGTLIFEMLTGLPPFFDENVQAMYKMILNNEVNFPELMSENAKDLIAMLLAKDPEERLGSKDDVDEIMAHPFFAGVDWDDVFSRKTHPQWVPTIEGETDVSHFDPEFTQDKSPSAPDDGICTDAQKQFVNFTCTQESTLDPGF